jgi:hypothetical protein
MGSAGFESFKPTPGSICLSLMSVLRGGLNGLQLADAAREARPSAQTHSKDSGTTIPWARPPSEPARFHRGLHTREAKPPLHLLSESVH